MTPGAAGTLIDLHQRLRSAVETLADIAREIGDCATPPASYSNIMDRIRGANTMNGYIVHDNEGVIHGFGSTEDDAWADMRRTMGMAHIEVLDDDAEAPEHGGNWCRTSDLMLCPATEALLQDVKKRGGAIAWSKIDRLACTIVESER